MRVMCFLCVLFDQWCGDNDDNQTTELDKN